MFFNRLSILIWLGLLLAVFFPYAGFKLSPLGLPILVLMSLVSFLPVQYKSLFNDKLPYKSLLYGLIICYSLFPALQMLMASIFFSDSKSLQLGVLLASISPIAIIAPQFLSGNSEHQRESLFYVVVSTLLYPIIAVSYIKLFQLDSLNIPFMHLIKDSALIALLPPVLSIILELIAPQMKQKFSPFVLKIAPIVNFGSIAFLVFIYFGSVFAKSQLSLLQTSDYIGLILISLFQDFGAFFIAKYFKFSLRDAVSFALKNVALSGGVLLIFYPQAIIACSAVFVAHALFFSFMKRAIENYSAAKI